MAHRGAELAHCAMSEGGGTCAGVEVIKNMGVRTEESDAKE